MLRQRDIAHVVLMPNHTPDKLQLFVRDFCSMRKRAEEVEEDGMESPLALLRTKEW